MTAEEMGTYFGNLFSTFDGENDREKKQNFDLGYKACVRPKDLTRHELFTVAFIIERMQSHKFGDVYKLEEIRLHILAKS